MRQDQPRDLHVLTATLADVAQAGTACRSYPSMRRDLRSPEYNLTDAELSALDERQLEAHAKRFVFGLGRSAGIRIRPTHFDGTLSERLEELARAMSSSEKQPPDALLGDDCVRLATELQEAVTSRHEPLAIVKLLIRYIDARVEVMFAGWVE
jgi:hypothetical protein